MKWPKLLASLRLKLQRNYAAGQIYSVGDKKRYRIVKLLVVDDDAVHVSVYKNVYTVRLEQVDESTLTLGTIHDADGFGVGHLPLSRKVFQSWHPEFVTKSSVSEAELEGYKIWKESHRGVWNIPWEIPK